MRFFDLKATLKRLDIKDRELAEFCGVKDRTVRRWKSDPSKMTVMAKKCTQQFLLFNQICHTNELMKKRSPFRSSSVGAPVPLLRKTEKGG